MIPSCARYHTAVLFDAVFQGYATARTVALLPRFRRHESYADPLAVYLFADSEHVHERAIAG